MSFCKLEEIGSVLKQKVLSSGYIKHHKPIKSPEIWTTFDLPVAFSSGCIILLVLLLLEIPSIWSHIAARRWATLLISLKEPSGTSTTTALATSNRSFEISTTNPATTLSTSLAALQNSTFLESNQEPARERLAVLLVGLLGLLKMI